MDLKTNYLGLSLAHPIMPGASPLVDDLDTVRRLEDAGAPAIVMHSLFEEQIELEEQSTIWSMEVHAEGYAEALSYFPRPDMFSLGPEQYLEQIRRIKQAVRVPVIASLNGVSAAGWLRYSELIEQAGADALELNIYHVPTSPTETAAQVEQRVLDVLEGVRSRVKLPIAVKLSPFYSAIAAFAQELARRGAQALVLFNRFYEPDFDIEALEVVPRLRLSEPSELLLRLHWIAILRPQLNISLAATGGVHSALDVIKAIMAGADAVQVVSALLQFGPEHLAKIVKNLMLWMEEHGYTSLEEMRGNLSLARCPRPDAFERGNYMRVLQSWSA
ncbi:MAG: dihydroorotate dehydrogenase-like protein [candidate division KSB1 bacterium]|nr:dihydroorotate dehydrogenase-like protein [candidate division KSB1 bacterium]